MSCKPNVNNNKANTSITPARISLEVLVADFISFGKYFNAARSVNPKIGTLIKKTQCQLKYVLIIPPTERPAPDPIAAKELKMPIARLRSFGSINVCVTSASEAGIRSAAPNPCSALNTASTMNSEDNPAPSDAIKNKNEPHR